MLFYKAKFKTLSRKWENKVRLKERKRMHRTHQRMAKVLSAWGTGNEVCLRECFVK